MDSESVEGRPGVLLVHSESNPLRDDLFLALKDGTTGMLGEAGVHGVRRWINVAEENGIVGFRFDVDTGVAEVGVAA